MKQPCETCCGNGGIITNWAAYLFEYHEDGGCGTVVTDCPDCDGTGYVEEGLCSDCPPFGYPTDETRCRECPRRTSDDAPCTDCGGTGITYQTERKCACQ